MVISVLSANEKVVKSVKDIFDAIGLEAGKIIQFKILRKTFYPNNNPSKWGFGGGNSSSSRDNGYQVLTIAVRSAPETDAAGEY